jgi:ferredoxin
MRTRAFLRRSSNQKEFTEMKHTRLFVALAVFCLLVGSAFAVAKLMPAVVDDNKCTGCGACVEEYSSGGISLNDQGIAVVDTEKCTGCWRCAKSCPVEVISTE